MEWPSGWPASAKDIGSLADLNLVTICVVKYKKGIQSASSCLEFPGKAACSCSITPGCLHKRSKISVAKKPPHSYVLCSTAHNSKAYCSSSTPHRSPRHNLHPGEKTNPMACSDMDKTGDDYVKQNQPGMGKALRGLECGMGSVPLLELRGEWWSPEGGRSGGGRGGHGWAMGLDTLRLGTTVQDCDYTVG